MDLVIFGEQGLEIQKAVLLAKSLMNSLPSLMRAQCVSANGVTYLCQREEKFRGPLTTLFLLHS